MLSDDQWKAYKTANALFAKTIKNLCSKNPDDDLLWLHNYHLLLVASELRLMGITARVGLFNHSPFPTSEFFRVLPMRSTLLIGMLGNDLLGFQTFHDSRHFLSSCTRVLAAGQERSLVSIFILSCLKLY